MTACPVCNKPVDPLRARFVSVRAGKIVPYCSTECRAAEDTKPTKQPEPEKPAEKPVEKAAEKPAEKPKEKPKAEARVPQKVADLDSGPVIEILHEPVSGVVTSANDERIT